ncbi:hypothetical protein [Rufibacter quisquiliarum]|uniref:YD repeat-containing protein n=1 Tax=Rufibacter quisquiliarum TaxID=1549639 RepID=A0A839GF38_9BACT|nr:hypothetical protein [Rufibacter quisquiliarum]MBA9078244.1 hypothetical protein [Rufibacter quisquiliarum]
MKATLLFCLCLLVAVAPKVQAQPGSPQKTNAVHRLAQLVDSFDKIQYRHLFTYDRQGRPATHQLDYSKDGKLVSTGILNYAYDPATGKLLSKTSD